MTGRAKIRWLLVCLGLGILLDIGGMAEVGTPVAPVTREVIGTGKYQTQAYVFTGAGPGPTVLVVGGVHGNEPAGHLAALRLAKRRWRLARGRLIIVPAANAPALKLGLRAVPYEGDLNRSFSAGANGQGAGALACALLAAVESWHVAAVVDLHEGRDYAAHAEESVGRSVIMYPNDASATLALAVLEALNAPPGTGAAFTPLGPPVQGSLTAALGAEGAAALIIETSERDPLEQRVKEHCLAVEQALQTLGLLQ
ncbi:MAG: uncharacterized protein PWR31_391 [Bacillota bacterium]|nr:uncharacterized protein [Bacillota bacterium]